MAMSDPIADMLTRIRNAQLAEKASVSMPSSKLKVAIAAVLKDEGYVVDFEVEGDARKILRIALKYNEDAKPVIRGIRRDSKPGLRKFCGWKDMPRVLGGLGIAVISTSSGVMSGVEARRRKLGGELVCSVW